MEFAVVSRSPMEQTVPGVGTPAWASALNCPSYHWGKEPIEMVPTECTIVVPSTGLSHISQVRKIVGDRKIIAILDRPASNAIYNRELREQLEDADYIGCRSHADVSHFEMLMPSSKVRWLPPPIGPVDWFTKLWKEDKQNFVIAMGNHPHKEHLLYNIMAIRGFHKESGLPITYIGADEQTRMMLEPLDLGIEWLPVPDTASLASLIASARLGIDLCATKPELGYNQLFAMCGTPLVTTRYADETGCIACDPHKTLQVVTECMKLYHDDEYNDLIRLRSWEDTLATYGYTASINRLTTILSG